MRGAFLVIVLLVIAGIGALSSGLVGGGDDEPRPPSDPALVLTGADPIGGVDVRLTAATRTPGPNTFAVDVHNNESGDVARRRRVRLAFTPLDDPDVRTSVLELEEVRDGTYVAEGGNLAFDGRWRITVFIGRLTGTAEVRFVVNTTEPDRDVERRDPGTYVARLGKAGGLELRVDPATLHVTGLDADGREAPLRSVVVTTQAGSEAPVRESLRRVSQARFAADVRLPRGETEVVVVARREGGTRLRAVFTVRP